MSIAEEVAAGVAKALGPIVENAVATVGKEVRTTADDLIAQVKVLLNGTKVTITIEPK